MNVVQIINNPVWGGGERYVLDLAGQLRESGHNVTIVSRPFEAVCAPFEREGFKVEKMSLRGFLDPFSQLRMARLYDSMEGPLVVHAHNFKTARIALAAKRLSRRADDIRILCTRHLVRPAKTSLRDTRLYNSLDAIIFVSAVARDTFLSSNPDVDRSRLHVVHNSIRLPLLPPVPTDKSHVPLKLLYAGILNKEKGLEVFFDALGELHDFDWILTVCGSGEKEYVDSLKERAEALGISSRVNFAGHCDNIFHEIDRHNVGVLPTIVPEALGLILLECMARCVPMITTSSGGQKEVVENGVTGILVSPGSVEQLAEAITSLAKDPALLDNMSMRAGKLFHDHFSYSVFFKKILAIYHA